MTKNQQSTTYISSLAVRNPTWPWVIRGRDRLTKLHFKGYGCNHEVLGVMEAQNFSKIGILASNLAAFDRFGLLAPLKPQSWSDTEPMN